MFLILNGRQSRHSLKESRKMVGRRKIQFIGSFARGKPVLQEADRLVASESGIKSFRGNAGELFEQKFYIAHTDIAKPCDICQGTVVINTVHHHCDNSVVFLRAAGADK